MIKKTKKIIFFASVILPLLFIVGVAFIPLTANAKDYCLDTAAKDTGLITDKTATPQIIIGTVIGAILSFVGVIFFLLIFYGGLRWMLAQGNEQEVEKAKQIIIAASIGLVIVLAAYAITAFVGQQLAGAD
jgi:cbb3-type cytochrome oxidase subunit 3